MNTTTCRIANRYTAMNFGFRVLCLNRRIPATAPNGPKNESRRRVDSLILHFPLSALRLSAPNAAKDIRLSKRYAAMAYEIGISAQPAYVVIQSDFEPVGILVSSA